MNENAPITLQTDVSDYGIGGYLFQTVDDLIQVIMCISKALVLTPEKKNATPSFTALRSWKTCSNMYLFIWKQTIRTLCTSTADHKNPELELYSLLGRRSGITPTGAWQVVSSDEIETLKGIDTATLSVAVAQADNISEAEYDIHWEINYRKIIGIYWSLSD